MNRLTRRACFISIGLGLLHSAVVVARQDPSSGEQDARNPVYVEDSPAAQRLVEHAGGLAAQKRTREAVVTYQKAIDQYPSKLMMVQEGRYKDVSRVVPSTIRSDDELLDAYRRLHDPLAERSLAMATRPRLAPAALAKVVAQYGLCRSALDAALMLAAWRLERGDFAGADSILRDVSDHPDVHAVWGQWQLMAAAGALYRGDAEALAAAAEALEAVGDRDAVAQLEQWKLALRRPRLEGSVDAMGVSAATTVPKPRSEPLWRLVMPTPPPYIEALRHGQARVRRNQNVHAWRFAYMLPTVLGDRLYVNDGGSVLALDRHAGRIIWGFKVDQRPEVLVGQATVKAPRGVPDHRGVAVTDDHVLAVLGHATPLVTRTSTPQLGTNAVCLRRSDGRLLWQVSPKQIDEGLVNAFFHGTPTVSGDQVFVMARCSQRSRFQDAYVVALHLQTGQLQWKRHLASAMPRTQYLIETLSQITQRDGRLYIADSLGAVSCLDGRTGSAHWVSLVRHAIKGRKTPRPTTIAAAPWQVSLPVQLRAGMVVRRGGGGNGAVLLDPESGRKRRDLENGSIRDALYLTAAGEDLLCVGPTLSLLDGRTLEPRWRTPLRHTSQLSAPHGRACVLRAHVVVPTHDRLVVVSLADGEVVDEHKVAAPGNVLVLDDEIVVAGMDHVSGYISWSDAYERLTRTIEAEPLDPMPALALTHLAVSSGRDEAALAAVDAALAALDQRHLARSDAGTRDAPVDPVQQHVFGELLRTVSQKGATSPQTRSTLYDRMAALTATASDEVSYRLSHGAFLAEVGRHRAAIDRYQSILDDATLSTQMHSTKEGLFQAGLEAQVRQSALRAAHGPQISEHLETTANQLLAELSGAAGTPPEKLVALARRFPICAAASSALLAAAERLAGDGESDAAIATLRDAYRLARDPAGIEAIVGRLVELNIEADRSGRARWWLRRMQREHEQLMAIRAGQRVPVDTWITELASDPSTAGRLPQLNVPFGRGALIQGRALAPRLQPFDQRQRDRFITHEGGEVQLRQGDKSSVVWTTTLQQEGPVQLLALTADQALLWSPQGQTLICLDAKEGKPQWRHDRFMTLITGGVDQRPPRPPALEPLAEAEQHFEDLLRQMQIDAAGLEIPVEGGELRLPGNVQEQVEALRLGAGLRVEAPQRGRLEVVDGAALFAVLNEMTLVVADSSGHLIAIDRRTGQTEWRRSCPIDWLTHLAVDEQTVLVAGVRFRSEPKRRAAILAIDVLSGKQVVATLTASNTVTWAALNGQSTLWYTTSNQVVAHSLDQNTQLWSRSIPGETFAGGHGLDNGVLMLRTNKGRLVAIDAATGRGLSPAIQTSAANRQALRMDPIEGQWHLFGPQTVMALDSAGGLLWSEAIADAEKRLVAQLVGAGYVVVVNQIEPAIEAPQGQRAAAKPAPRPGRAGQWVYRLYLLDRQNGLLSWQRDLPPLPAPLNASDAMFLQNRLVLPTDSFTVVIPGSGG